MMKRNLARLPALRKRCSTMAATHVSLDKEGLNVPVAIRGTHHSVLIVIQLARGPRCLPTEFSWSLENVGNVTISVSTPCHITLFDASNTYI